MMTINFTTALLPYQAEAVKKLSKIRVGALFMEQGTGKTRTALELIQRRASSGKIDAVLWLCPCSVRRNLREDIIYHCGQMPREIIIRGIESLSSADSLYLKLLELVDTYKCYLVVDESALVKNPEAIRSKRITELADRCRYKLILNGTPISKNEADLFSQFFILDWRILGYKSYYSFAANHLEYYTVVLPSGREVKTDQVKRVLNTDYLSEKIAPYTYQIRKQEALGDLPKKTYAIKYYELGAKQEKIYGQTKVAFTEIVEDWKPETVYKMFTALQHVTSGREVTSPPTRRMETRPIYNDIEDNPRIEALADVLREIGDEKVIIFCKYIAEANEIETLCRRMGIKATEFTGRCQIKKRLENLDSFRGDAQVLVANKSCGAYGLNLQFCRNIVFYDNDFDYATRAQAEDRVHRFGQTREVRIYDICADDTIDSFILDNLDGKITLAEAFRRKVDKVKDKKWEKSAI